MLDSVGNCIAGWASKVESKMTQWEEGEPVFALAEMMATVRVIEGVAFIAIGCAGKALGKVTKQRWMPDMASRSGELIGEGVELVKTNARRAAIMAVAVCLVTWTVFRK